MVKNKILPIICIILVIMACSLPEPISEWGSTPANSSTPDLTDNPITQAATLTAGSPDLATPDSTSTYTDSPVTAGEWSLFQGDYDTAQTEFETALDDRDPEVQAAAIAGLGRVAYLKENYQSAIQYFNSIIQLYPQSSTTSTAYFFLGKCYDTLEDSNTAADAYRMFLTIKPGIIDDYIQELLGDSLFAAGNLPDALTAYQAAIQATSYGGSDTVNIKVAQVYLAQKDYENAIRQLIHIYETTQSDYTKAKVNNLLADAYFSMEMPEQAYARYQDSVQNFPLSYDTYLGLVVLVDDGQTVDELQRGIIDYYAQKYGVAIDAFDRYLNATPGHDDTAHYYKGLALRALGEYDAAIEEWQIQVDDHPAETYYVDALEDIAYTRWAYQDMYEEGAQVLLDFANNNPNAPQAADLLYQAARILERDNQLESAGETWEYILDLNPAYENSYRALTLAGISFYRAENYSRALTDFQRLSVLAITPDERAAAYLWIGKTQTALNLPEEAHNSWQTAAQSDPTGYYSERAYELMDGKSPFSIDGPYDLNIDMEEDKKLAEAWMRITFSIAEDVSLNGLDILAQDQRSIRGDIFWSLGLYYESHLEYESLRQDYATDPVNTYRLIDRLLELGFYRSAILASRQILSLANLDDASTLMAPSFFNHIRFGVYHQNLILPITQDKGFHPLFIASLIRQESMFEGFATSSAGAQGMMQLMPATAQEVVTYSGWPENFTISDLYRPYINVPIGIRYLARQRDYFNGDLFVSLAAYNSGPGNAIEWNTLSGGDPDLFLEIVRYDETRRYLIQISEFYHIYWNLYGSTP